MSGSQRTLEAMPCIFYMTTPNSASHEQLVKYECTAEGVNGAFGVGWGLCHSVSPSRGQGNPFASSSTDYEEGKSGSKRCMLVGGICFLPVRGF